jgi:hypothetical protein
MTIRVKTVAKSARVRRRNVDSVMACDDVVGAVGVARPDELLVEFADAGARHLVDERPAFRQTEVRLQMFLVVPHERGDPLPRGDADACETLGELCNAGAPRSE